MPLTAVDLTSLAGTSPVDRLIQRERDLNAYGDPLAEAQAEFAEQPKPTLGQTWAARAGTQLIKGVLDTVYAPSREIDADFDPFDYIKSTPELAEDPIVLELVKRDQFIGSNNLEAFLFDLDRGRRFFEDLETLHRSSNTKAGITFAGALLGDPTNLIPLGFAFKGLKGANTVRKVIGTGGVTAGITLGFKGVESHFNPASNDPGLADEAAAAATGAVMGASIGFLASPLFKDLTTGLVPTRRIRQLHKNVAAVVNEPAFTDFQPGAVRDPADIKRITLEQAVAQSEKHLRDVLAEDAVEGRTVVALYRPGDKVHQMVKAARAKYQRAGIELREAEHPDQHFLDTIESVREILDTPDTQRAATQGELAGGIVDKITGGVSKVYANMQAAVTPGGRIANASIARFNSVYRTLSSSARTITAAQASSPFTHQSGASAEGFKSLFTNWKDTTTLMIRASYSRNRTPGPITYNGESIPSRFAYSRFKAAVNDYIRRQHAAQHGFIPKDAIPADVHPSIVNAANGIRSFFKTMAQQLGDAGLADESKLLNEWYLPRVYDVGKVRANRDDFINRLVRSFNRGSTFIDGRHVNQSERFLIREVAQRVKDDEIKAAYEKVTVPREGMLSQSALERYEIARQAYYRDAAETAWKKIAESNEPNMVDDLVKHTRSEATSTRQLNIDESDLQTYMVRDVEQIIDRYTHITGGKIAVRRAIAEHPELWKDAHLQTGSPVQDGESLMRYLNETVEALQTYAEHADRRLDGSKKIEPLIRDLKKRIDRDFAVPLNFLEGGTLVRQSVQHEAFSWIGNQLLRLSYLNKLGSVAWAQMNDIAPITMMMIQRPQMVPKLTRMLFHLNKMERRQLEIMGQAFDRIARTRAIADVESPPDFDGFGTGATRAVSRSVARGLQKAGDVNARVSLLNWITDTNKRAAGMLLADRSTQLSKRMLKAQEHIAAGMDETAALRKAGLSRYEAAKLNQLGFNAQRAQQYHELVFEHGLMSDGTPIKQHFKTQDAYMRSKAIVDPNMDDWPLTDKSVRSLRDVLLVNHKAEVDRSLVVTPGQFDAPLINNTIMGKLFNQFQTFGMAFANQRLAPMAQMPAQYQLWYGSVYMMIGAVSDAISSHLSGRRSFDETVRMWEENPLAAAYNAWDRAGLSGWISRYLAVADIPGMLGAGDGSSASRHITQGQAFSYFGPAAADLQNIAERVLEGRNSVQQGNALRDIDYRRASKLLPFQNLIWFRLGMEARRQLWRN